MTLDQAWIGFGLLGQIIFGGRFILQWIASERRRESHIDRLGTSRSSKITTAYAIHKRDIVFIIGQAPSSTSAT